MPGGDRQQVLFYEYPSCLPLNFINCVEHRKPVAFIITVWVSSEKTHRLEMNALNNIYILKRVLNYPAYFLIIYTADYCRDKCDWILAFLQFSTAAFLISSSFSHLNV